MPFFPFLPVSSGIRMLHCLSTRVVCFLSLSPCLLRIEAVGSSQVQQYSSDDSHHSSTCYVQLPNFLLAAPIMTMTAHGCYCFLCEHGTLAALRSVFLPGAYTSRGSVSNSSLYTHVHSRNETHMYKRCLTHGFATRLPRSSLHCCTLPYLMHEHVRTAGRACSRKACELCHFQYLALIEITTFSMLACTYTIYLYSGMSTSGAVMNICE